MKKVSVGGGQGFWGDSPDGAIQMIAEGQIDYLACDYLAELTLSIMARQKMRNPKAGYATDFISLMDKIAVDAKKKKIGIISNAGGMNTKGAVKRLEQLAKTKGLKNYRIGYVLGDDLTAKLPELISQGAEFINTETGRPISDIQDKIINANVYHGHEPIQECLKNNADVVVTGRAADSALFLAPFKEAFDWENDDWNNLARGIMAGHLLECGGQVSGGNYDYDWRSVPNMDQLGFPIAELTKTDFILTKTENSGGLITEQSCKEQMLYEIHNPAEYITPDVTVDISQVKVNEVSQDRVSIGNINGRKRPELLKLSIGYHAGYKVVTHLSFAWPDAYEKAQLAKEIVLKKMKRKQLKTEDIQIDYIGLNSLHLDVANMDEEMIKDLNEVVLRIGIRTNSRGEAAKIIPEISPLQLNGPPGSSFFGGRSSIQSVIGLWPTLIGRDSVNLTSHILEVN